MVKMILLGLLIWFLYNLVFRFIIPVYRTSSQLRKKFREMSEQMQQQQGFQQNTANSDPQPQSGRSNNTSGQARKGDYIDFEEVK